MRPIDNGAEVPLRNKRQSGFPPLFHLTDSLIQQAIRALSSQMAEAESARVAKYLLHAISTQECSFDAIWHPLGFMYIELFRIQGCSLRFHIWSPEAGDYVSAGWPIHRHDWRLSSYVICGSFQNCMYMIQEPTKGPTHRLYEIDYRRSINVLRSTSTTVNCSLAQVNQVTADSHYELEANVFHEIKVESIQLTATMILATSSPSARNGILGPLLGPRTMLTERRVCSEEATRKAVEAVLSTLA